MKKIIPFLFTLFFTLSLSAQNEATKFLGIPVDGTKSAMIQKLQAKGFTYDRQYDVLTGEFNGEDVFISIVTDNNKVRRIVVVELTERSKAQTIIHFNQLCRQFENNKKYIPARVDQTLSENENISYEMTVNDKQYQAVFYQLPVENAEKRPVWFDISKAKYKYDYYSIVIYYDNEFNHADGEDL